MQSTTPRRLALGLALVASLAAGPAPAQPSVGEQLVDALEGVFGANPGFRRGHARGFCATGEFLSSGAGAALSTAGTLAEGARSTVTARFSIAGGNPQAPENVPAPRGMALSLNAPNGDLHEFVLLSTPMFNAANPRSFLDLLAVVRPDPTTRQPNPAAIAAAAATHPDWAPQGAYLRATAPSASYATTPYFGIHSFIFINRAGARQAARWTFEPVAGRVGLTPEERTARGPAYLDAELHQRIATGPLEWRALLQLPEPGDAVDDPIVAWPESRRTIEVGRLRITGLAPTGTAGACDGQMFNPTLLPDGVEASGDPILAVRAEAYAVSLTRRSAR